MAYFDTTWYCNFGDGSTTGYYAVAKRPQNAAVAAGQIVRQFTAPAVGSERVFVCTVSGTTANTTDASWATSRGSQVVDGTATWMECTGAAAVNGDVVNTPTWSAVKATGLIVTRGAIIKRNNGESYHVAISSTMTPGASEPAFSNTPGASIVDGTGTWVCLGPVGNFTGGQAPHARLANVFGTNWFASGNTVYVGNNHAETQTTALTLAPSSALMAKILCHNSLGAYPPAASDITTGATITIPSGSSPLSITGQGSFYFYGITFAAATGSVVIGAGSVGQTQNWYFFDNCSFASASTTIVVSVGASSLAWGIVIFNNTTVKFGNVGGSISPYFAQFIWQNTGQILAAGSVVPNDLIESIGTSGRFNTVVLRNLDLSQLIGNLFLNTTNTTIGSLIVQDCKLNAAMTVTRPINSGMTVQLIRSDSAGTSYKSQRIAYEGTETTETSIVRTDGAVDPTGVAQSRKIVTTADAQWLRPFKAEPMAVWNSTVGSPITVTVCGVANAASLPNNDDIWLELEHLGSASDPLGTIVTTTKASVLAANAPVASDGSTWSWAAHAVFDPFTAVNTTLSNNNLTATHSNTTNNSGVRLANTQTVGKYYWETTLGVRNGFTDVVGLVESGATFAVTANTTSCLGFGGGSWFSNGTSGSSALGPFSVGDVIGVAVDLSARWIWFRKNGGAWRGFTAGAADPTAGLNGIPVEVTVAFEPFIGFGGAGTAAGDTMTANFGATPYQTAAPTDYGNWPKNWAPFKLATSITPQLPGYIHARVRVGKVSATYYVDPKVTVT